MGKPRIKLKFIEHPLWKDAHPDHPIFYHDFRCTLCAIVEDIKGKMPFVGQPPKARRKLSKAELREQAAAAFLAWREGQTTKDK